MLMMSNLGNVDGVKGLCIDWAMSHIIQQI